MLCCFFVQNGFSDLILSLSLQVGESLVLQGCQDEWLRPPVLARFLHTGQRLHPEWGCTVM